jgi:hypothetical protein
MITKQDDYNNVPVHYCKSCLSLKIKDVDIRENAVAVRDTTVSYCGECGWTDLDSAHIEEWKVLYKEKYGKDFIDEGIK